MENDVYNNSNELFKMGMDTERMFEQEIKDDGNKYDWLGDIQDLKYHEDLKTQKRGIDYTITSTSGILTLDVKRDNYIGKTNNLLAEYFVYYNNGGQGKGWMLYGESDYILFMNPKVGCSYLIDFERYKEAVLDYIIINNFNVRTHLVRKINNKATFNILIPESLMSACFQKYTIGGNDEKV